MSQIFDPAQAGEPFSHQTDLPALSLEEAKEIVRQLKAGEEVDAQKLALLVEAARTNRKIAEIIKTVNFEKLD